MDDTTKVLIKRLEKEIERLVERTSGSVCCQNCKWFAEDAGDGPDINSALGPNYCWGHEMSCDRNDVRFCFTKDTQ